MENNIDRSEKVRKACKSNLVTWIAAISLVWILWLSSWFAAFYYKFFSESNSLEWIKFDSEEISKLRKSLSSEVESMSDVFVLNTAIANILEIYIDLKWKINNNKTSSISNDTLIDYYLILNKISVNLIEELSDKYKEAVNTLKEIIKDIYNENNWTDISENDRIKNVWEWYWMKEANDFFVRNRSR